MTDLDSPAVWSALAYEVEGTWSLLGQSERMLRDLRLVTEDYDPLFACLATGAEKLLKIVHGLVVEHERGQWPSKDSMSTTYSHAIVELDARRGALGKARPQSGRRRRPATGHVLG